VVEVIEVVGLSSEGLKISWPVAYP
jgi:hypothetical protein